MPQGTCGFQYSNFLDIPGVGTFPLNVEDYDLTIGTEGAKSLSVKIGSFVDSVNTYRAEIVITLYRITRTQYDAIKEFVKQDLLTNYLNNYVGSITVDLNGERFDDAVIKNVNPQGTSVLTPNPVVGQPDIEYLDSVKLKLLSKEYRLI